MILELLLALLLVNAVAYVFKRLSIPSVLGMILVGVLFGIPQIHRQIAPDLIDVMPDLAKYGLFALMFTAGLEVSWAMLLKERGEALIVAFWGLCVPFLIGSLTMILLGYDLAVAVAMGIAISITAEATKAKVLLEMGKLKTRLGSLMIGAGIMDDIIGIILFSVFALLFFKGGDGALHEFVNLMIVFFAFFAGVFTHVLLGREKGLIKGFEFLTAHLLVPFFFLAMGMHFEFGAFMNSGLLIVLITLIGMGGKILGVLISRIWVKISLKQAHLVGWGMNSRGGVELALAYSGYNLGILSSELYSAIIVTTFVSTFLFPIVFSRIVKADKKII